MQSKNEILRLHREYNKIHREEINLKNAIYRIKNKEKIRIASAKKRSLKIKEYSNYRKYKRKNSLESWSKFIPYKTKCQICNKTIYFKALNKINSIHFDHRHGGNEPIRINPSQWLKNHPHNKVNEKLWVKSDFGMLCHLCNYRLPTKNRKDWVSKMNKYVSRLGDQPEVG